MNLFKRCSLFAAVTLSFLGVKAQDYEKMLINGKVLYDFSITEGCYSGECDEGGYVIAGTTEDESGDLNMVVFKIDDSGNPTWTIEFDEADVERVIHVEACSIGYVLVGTTNKPGSHLEMVFITIDHDGNTINEEIIKYPNLDDWDMVAMHVIPVKSGEGEVSFVATGFVSQGLEDNAEKHSFIMGLDQSGSVVWSTLLESSEQGGLIDADMGSFALEVEGSGFYITGSANVEQPITGSTHQGTLSAFVDYQGNLIWSNNFALEGSGSDSYDMGAGAVLVDGENIVVLSNSTELDGYYLTRISPSNGAIMQQKSFTGYYPGISGFSISKVNKLGFVVSGLIGNTTTSLSCSSSNNTIPFLSLVSDDLQSNIMSVNYPMNSENHHIVGGDFLGAFGGTSSSMRTLINTPEMAYVGSDGRVSLIAYRDDGPLGYEDLQFISSMPTSWDWCLREDFTLEPEERGYVTSEDLQGFDDQIEQISGYNSVSITINTLDCSSSGINGAQGGFPILQEASQTVGGEVGSSIMEVVDGYTYVAGVYGGSVDFGGQSLSGKGVYIAKYDIDGSLIWLKDGADPNATTQPFYSYCTSLEVDNDHNVYVSGVIAPSEYLKFSTNPTMDYWDGSTFLVKFNANGSVIWQEQYHNGNFAVSPYPSLSVDKIGNIYLTMTSNGLIILPSSLTGYNVGYNNTLVVMKINPNNGVDVWRHTNSLLDDHYAEDIVAGMDGKLYIGGFYAPSSGPDLVPFLAKLSNSGTSLVVNDFSYGSVSALTLGAWITDIDVRGSTIYVAGTTNGYGEGMDICSTTLYAEDAWISSHSTSTLSCIDESFVWATADGTQTFKVAAVPNGDVYLYGFTYFAGYNNPIVSFDGNIVNGPSGNDASILLAKYDAGLNFIWGEVAGAGGNQGGVAEAFDIDYDDKSCGVFISGSNNIAFTIASETLPGANGMNGFILRIDQSGSSYFVHNPASSSVGNIYSNSDQEQLSWNDLSGSSAINFYPVPVNDLLTIEVENRIIDAGEVLDLTGRKVVNSFELHQGKNILDLSSLPAGVYLLSTKSKGVIVKNHRISVE